MRMIGFCVLSVVVATSAGAQQNESEPSGGLLYGIGVGAGTARVTCPICGSQAGVAPSLQLRFGGSFSPVIGWGIEGNGWLEEGPNASVRNVAYGVGAAVYWYLAPQAPRWYLKAGVGPLWYRVEDVDVDPMDVPSPSITSTSFAGHFGVGLEIPAGRLAVVPFINYAGSIYGSLYRDNTRVTEAQVSFVQLGVGLTWR
jgi:hypothetical protein